LKKCCLKSSSKCRPLELPYNAALDLCQTKDEQNVVKALRLYEAIFDAMLTLHGNGENNNFSGHYEYVGNGIGSPAFPYVYPTGNGSITNPPLSDVGTFTDQGVIPPFASYTANYSTILKHAVTDDFLSVLNGFSVSGENAVTLFPIILEFVRVFNQKGTAYWHGSARLSHTVQNVQILGDYAITDLDFFITAIYEVDQDRGVASTDKFIRKINNVGKCTCIYRRTCPEDYTIPTYNRRVLDPAQMGQNNSKYATSGAVMDKNIIEQTGVTSGWKAVALWVNGDLVPFSYDSLAGATCNLNIISEVPNGRFLSNPLLRASVNTVPGAIAPFNFPTSYTSFNGASTCTGLESTINALNKKFLNCALLKASKMDNSMVESMSSPIMYSMALDERWRMGQQEFLSTFRRRITAALTLDQNSQTDFDDWVTTREYDTEPLTKVESKKVQTIVFCKSYATASSLTKFYHDDKFIEVAVRTDFQKCADGSWKIRFVAMYQADGTKALVQDSA